MTCCEIVISVLYVVFIVIVTSCSYVYCQYNRKASTDDDLQVDTNITDEDMEEHNRNIDNLNKLTEKIQNGKINLYSQFHRHYLGYYLQI